jgi:hypothetical protein
MIFQRGKNTACDKLFVIPHTCPSNVRGLIDGGLAQIAYTVGSLVYFSLLYVYLQYCTVYIYCASYRVPMSTRILPEI